MESKNKKSLELVRYQPITSVKDVFKNIIDLFKYFTIWMLVIDILYLTGVVQGIELFLITLHIFVLVFCAYLFYYKLKKFKTKIYSLDLIFRGKYLMLIDFLFHYVPLIFIIKSIRSCRIEVKADKLNLILTLLIPLLYIMMVNGQEIYHIEESKSFVLFSVYLLVFYTIYFIFIDKQ